MLPYSNSPKTWPVDANVQEQMLHYFGCRFEELFETVLVNPETPKGALW